MEEEHQTWYFFSFSVNLLLLLRLLQLYTRKTQANAKISQNVEEDELVHQGRKSDNRLNDKGPRNRDTLERITVQDNDAASYNEGMIVQITHYLRLIAVLVLSRIQRSWNRTGDKWATLPDVGDWLVRLLHFLQ